MSLILDGEITQLDNSSKQIIKDRFFSSRYPEKIQEAGVFGNVMGILFFGVYWAVWRAILAASEQCQSKCGIFKITERRDACVNKCRIQEYTKKLDAIRKQEKNCRESSDPERCRRAASMAAQKMEEKLSRAEEKLADLESKGRGYYED